MFKATVQICTSSVDPISMVKKEIEFPILPRIGETIIVLLSDSDGHCVFGKKMKVLNVLYSLMGSEFDQINIHIDSGELFDNEIAKDRYISTFLKKGWGK